MRTKELQQQSAFAADGSGRSPAAGGAAGERSRVARRRSWSPSQSIGDPHSEFGEFGECTMSSMSLGRSIISDALPEEEDTDKEQGLDMGSVTAVEQMLSTASTVHGFRADTQ